MVLPEIETELNQPRGQGEAKNTKINGVEIFEEGETTVAETELVIENEFKGLISPTVFAFYIKNGGKLTFILTSLMFGLSVAFSFGTDWWAGKWFSNELNLSNSQSIGIYAALITAFLATSLTKSLLFSRFAPEASYKIFRKLLKNLLKKPLSFFDSNPSGVIINRAVDDLETVELEFGKQAYIFYDLLFIILGSYVAVAFTFLIFVVIIFLITFVHVLKFVQYLKASTELKRVYRVARAPVQTALSEMANGLSQIRVYGYGVF